MPPIPNSRRTCITASIVVLAALCALWLLTPIRSALAGNDGTASSLAAVPQATPLTWLASRVDGFSQSAESVQALAEFNGRLYAGLAANAGSAPSLVWVYDGQSGWNPSSMPSFGGGNLSVEALADYGGTLYAATSNQEGAQVWSSGGEGWSHAADMGFDQPSNHAIVCLLPFRGRLYAGTRNAGGAQIWAYDGLIWRQVVSGGLNDPRNVAVEALAEHDGVLYAGTRNGQGAQVWSSSDGAAWNAVASGGFGQSANECVAGLASFRGGLYAAVENSDNLGGQVWSYNSWVGWQVSATDGFATPSQPADHHNLAVTALTVHDGLLFAGTHNVECGAQVWFTDGYGWWPSTKTGVGAGAGNHTIGTLSSYAGELWAGLGNSIDGASVWRGGPEIGLQVTSRNQVVTAPANLHYQVRIQNTLETALVNLKAFSFWDSTDQCVYDAEGRAHLRWDIGDLSPGESRDHQFLLQTHSWCETQSVTNTVRLEADNLAPLFAFASSEVIAAPVPTASPSPSPTLRNPLIATLQQGADGYSGALDTHLSQSSPTTMYCQEPRIRVGANQGLAGLLRFDLGSIPSGATVVSATLHLYGIDWAQGRDIQVGAYVISRTVDVCEANWSYSQAGEHWGASGCQNLNTDRRAFPEAAFSTQGLRHWYPLDVTSAVRGWVDGSLANSGLLLLGEASESEIHAFASGQHAQGAERPKLSIAYFPSAPPAGTPTPTATETNSPTNTQTPTATSSATPVCTDPYEPNESFAEAWDMGWGGQFFSYICSPQDVDYYRADATEVALEGFSIVLRDLSADYDLYVYDAHQRQIAVSAESGLISESAVVPGQAVYVRVSSADGAHDPQHPYRLDVIPMLLATSTSTPTSTATGTLQPTETATPTGTSQPSATSGPTVTVSPTIWLVYLPVIVNSTSRR